jgi:hypothetical protein
MAGTSNILDIDRVTTAQEFDLSNIQDDPRGKFGVITINRVIAGAVVTETVRYSPGGMFMYCKANATIVGADVAGGGDACKVDDAGTDANKPGFVVPTAAAAAQIVAGISRVSVPNGSFFWLQIRGRVYNAKVTTAGTAEGDALGANPATAGTLVGITASASPTQAEIIAAIRYASGRRAMALVNFGTNLWDVNLAG